jgi:hypothetical protein
LIPNRRSIWNGLEPRGFYLVCLDGTYYTDAPLERPIPYTLNVFPRSPEAPSLLEDEICETVPGLPFATLCLCTVMCVLVRLSAVLDAIYIGLSGAMNK